MCGSSFFNKMIAMGTGLLVKFESRCYCPYAQEFCMWRRALEVMS